MVKHFCDICGRETNRIKSKSFLVSFNGFYNNNRDLDICDSCEEKLEDCKKQTEVNFMKNSYWWKQNSDVNGEIDYGEFRQVGTCEQGGMMCPKCGHSNNSYTFNGTCQSCGYTKVKS